MGNATAIAANLSSRTRRLLPTLILRCAPRLCGLALLGAVVMPLAAQDSFDDDFGGFQLPSTTVCFGMTDITTPRALEICDALALKQNVRARELAQKWIADEPESAAAQFSLAEVLIQVEGNLARALFHLNRAEELTNYASMGRALASGNVEWYYLTIAQLSYVHQLMGNQQSALDYLDKLSSIFGQDVESYRGWPLIEMRRWDDARESANRVLANSNDPLERSRAWNTLCAVELAGLRPPESMEACDMTISEDEEALASSNGRVDTVYLLNASEVALSMLRMEEAEEYLVRASRYIDPRSVGDPWINMLYLYMNQGRFDEARSALDNLIVWRDAQDPIVGVMNRAEHFLASATFLLLAGYPEDAATLSRTALNQPDRTGAYSADEAQKDSIAALINYMANYSAYQMKLEEAAMLDFPASLQARLDGWEFRFKAWRSARHAASLFADRETLQNRLRPYAPLDVYIPEWIEPEMVTVLGEGVIASILEQTLEVGAFRLNEGYYHAYHAEIAAKRRQDSRTLEAAQMANQLLPPQEVMLRARLAARSAEAAWREGDTNLALDYYEQALETDPGVFRRLGLSIPVRITGVDDAFVRQVIDYLEDSPRFRSHPQGLTLEVYPGTDLMICLRAQAGHTLSCPQLEAFDDTLELTPEQQLVQTFHQQTFGLGYDISQTQRMRLMGSSAILDAGNNPRTQQNRDAVLQQ